MLKRLAVIVMMGAVGLAVTAAPARAALITGAISFAGDAMPLGGGTWGSAIGIDFGTNGEVAASPNPTGAYAGTEGVTTTFTDFNFTTGLPVVSLWSFSSGGVDYSFNLTSLDAPIQGDFGDPVSSFIFLNGSGTLLATGFDPTPGLFNFTSQGLGTATFSFSSSNIATTPVPEPASLLLLGTGLVAVARRIHKGRKQA